MELYYIYDVKLKTIYDCRVNDGKKNIPASVVFYNYEEAKNWAKDISKKSEIRKFEIKYED